MAKTIVILGGAYGGLHVAHYLLKNEEDVKVILVSKSSHMYWCIASVRAIVPGQFQEDQYFGSLATALGRYPQDRAELVIGSAEAVDVVAKTVTVAVTAADGSNGSDRTIAYDHLVLATGARVREPQPEAAAGSLGPWKGSAGTFEDDAASVRALQAKVQAAKRIVVVGGGSTGVEVAGELGYEYGTTKEIILLARGKELLGGGVNACVGAAALHELRKLHVDVRLESGLSASRVLPDGRVELTVSGAAEPLVTDVYLAAMGLVPNTDYLDPKLVDARTKNVVVDAFFRVAGVASHDVWAVGDAVAQPREGYMITQKQADGVAKNIVQALHGKDPSPVKTMPVDVYAVAVGRGRGVGRMGSISLPSLFIWLAKGRTLATQYLPSYVDGSIA